jgi:hypothetical protein
MGMFELRQVDIARQTFHGTVTLGQRSQSRVTFLSTLGA